MNRLLKSLEYGSGLFANTFGDMPYPSMPDEQPSPDTHPKDANGLTCFKQADGTERWRNLDLGSV